MIQSEKVFIRCFNLSTLCCRKSKGENNLYKKESLWQGVLQDHPVIK